MRERFELWGGITVSDSEADIRRKFPNASGQRPIDLGQFDLGGLVVSAQWYRWREADTKVKLIHVCTQKDADIHARILRKSISHEFGQGKLKFRHNGIEWKVWNLRYVRCQLRASLSGHNCHVEIEFFRPLYLGENYWAVDDFTILK